MAHELEMNADGTARMFSVRETPWHTLGTILSDAPRTSREAMVAAGADWTVSRAHIALASDQLLGASRPIESHRAIVRDTDMRVLGVVGEGYTPVQNAEAFGWFDHVVGEGRATFETAGVLREGKTVWVLARLGETFEVVPGDAVRGFLLLSNSHDGSRAVQARFTPIRVVCANTLTAAGRGNAGADRPIAIRHTSSVSARLQEAAVVMGIAAKQMEDTSEAFRMIARVQMGAAKAREFFETIVDGKRDNTGKLAARSANVVDELSGLFDGKGIGIDLPGVRGTAWAAYNCVTEYVDYLRGASKSGDARLESIAFGSGLAMKQRALSSALALV